MPPHGSFSGSSFFIFIFMSAPLRLGASILCHLCLSAPLRGQKSVSSRDIFWHGEQARVGLLGKSN
jgi:hypothetical protein